MFLGQAYKARGSFPECTSLFCPAWWRALFSSVWVAPSSLPLRTTMLKDVSPRQPPGKTRLQCYAAGGLGTGRWHYRSEGGLTT